MKTASISSLKNSLSARLKEVVAGESLLVTDHRKPVAVLRPLSGELASKRMANLVTRGLVSPPRRPLAVDEFLALPRPKGANLIAAIIEERDTR